MLRFRDEARNFEKKVFLEVVNSLSIVSKTMHLFLVLILLSESDDDDDDEGKAEKTKSASTKNKTPYYLTLSQWDKALQCTSK